MQYYLNQIVNNAPVIVIHFTVYSFMGWLIEVLYRSITQRRFVNAGFLYGTFIPIYGFGAAIITIIDSFISDYNILIQILLYGIILTALEYMISVIFEKAFKLKLWDYTENRFNLNGRVCLSFSLFWAILAFIFVSFIQPVITEYVNLMDRGSTVTTAIVITSYYGIDTVFSIISLQEFRRNIRFFYTEYIANNNREIEKKLLSFKRLLRAFPNLNKYLNRNINDGIRNRVNSLLKSLTQKIISEIDGRRPLEDEYYDSVKDILNNDEFLKLQHYFHHNSSILEHVKEVSYFSYRICKLFNMDFISAARGGLLHDFFLYDWRDHDVPDLPKEKFHGLEHPKIALENAGKHFNLNKIEKDIIIKHMWPLTIMPPRYRESFVVSFVDKYISSKEFFDELKRNRSKNVKQNNR